MTDPITGRSHFSGRNNGADGCEESIWEITLRPADCQDTAWRSHFLGHIRAALEKKLRDDSQAQELIWRTPLGTVEVRPRSGCRAGGLLKLAFAAPVCALKAPGHAAVGAGDPAPEPDGALPSLRLPDEGTRLLGQRLVGLESVRRDVLLQWECRWDGGLEAWSRKAGSPVPPALHEQLRTGHALWVFHGDPGTGKSALAQVLADDYARRQGVAGTVLWLTTQARGTGLVGDFSRRLRAAFRQLAALPEDEIALLILDEADALAMRRSEAQSHQEDKAATSTLIQALDETAGRRRLGIVMTTNSLTNVDAAVQRRARIVAFGRPDAAARRTLLYRWLPHLTADELSAAAQAADAMTPADIERALGEAWLAAIGAGMSLTPEEAISCLRAAMRTGAV